MNHMNHQQSVITLTFGDQAENHVGMEKLGKLVDVGQGFSRSDLEQIQVRLKQKNIICQLYDLSGDEKNEEKKDACVLVIRNAVNQLSQLIENNENDEKDFEKEMFDEQASLNMDKKVYMYGRVVNKHARWNLCFDDQSHDPDYENGKGRVISFDNIPITSRLMNSFPDFFGEKANGLKGEGNYYYDIRKCGIGFHGDSERRKVIAIRLGASLPLFYQWYKNGNPIGDRIEIHLNGGDMYVMSEKAVGTDWKRKKVFTLRHATGCTKFTNVKKKEEKKEKK